VRVRGVEVDVVGHGGCCWVEVKHQEVFGTDSVHWKVCGCVGVGNGGEGGGLLAGVWGEERAAGGLWAGDAK
jgi:hypothetical protein